MLRIPRERKRNNCEQILREMCAVGVQQTFVRVVREDTPPLLPVEGWRGGGGGGERLTSGGQFGDCSNDLGVKSLGAGD